MEFVHMGSVELAVTKKRDLLCFALIPSLLVSLQADRQEWISSICYCQLLLVVPKKTFPEVRNHAWEPISQSNLRLPSQQVLSFANVRLPFMRVIFCVLMELNLCIRIYHFLHYLLKRKLKISVSKQHEASLHRLDQALQN